MSAENSRVPVKYCRLGAHEEVASIRKRNNRKVRAMTIIGDNVYVGGLFTKAGDVAADNIAGAENKVPENGRHSAKESMVKY